MLRPLSQVEIIPMPYVTEATKVNIILPVTVHEAEALSKFLAVYEKVWFIFMVLDASHFICVINMINIF